MTENEKKEARNLATYAVKSCESKGRKHKEKFDDKRLNFQRDKERIIHSKAFRRLDEKTQVFVAGSGDHYRTRLTHTLEVAQVSRDIARRLNLNEDLCESIALAHDLGHPPFGHSGEEALNEIMRGYGMHFEHNQQSKRVVEFLEKAYPGFGGLNLTFEVLEGLMKHQTAFDQAGRAFEIFPHIEAQVVNIADEIAYTNHDIDDGLRAGFIEVSSLKNFKLWQVAEEIVFKKYGKIGDEQVWISRIISSIMSLMIDDFCQQTSKNIKKFKIKTLKDVKNHKGAIGEFSLKMRVRIKEIRNFLYNYFYLHPKIKVFNLQGKRMIKKMFEYYMKNPSKFPKKDMVKKNDIMVEVVKDYIAGMTDRFLEKEFSKIFKK